MGASPHRATPIKEKPELESGTPTPHPNDPVA